MGFVEKTILKTNGGKGLREPQPSRRGAAMLVLILLILVIFIVMATMSVDVAFMQLVRSELRAATDSAARAGSEALSRLQDENAAEPESGAGDGSHIDQCFPTPPPPDNVLISPMRTRLTLG
mgnify:CR=1 FL=1